MSIQTPEISVREPDTVAVLRFKSSTWYGCPTATLSHFENLDLQEIPRSPYGGRADRQEEATGYFHAKKIDGAWTVIDPEGYHFMMMAACCVDPHDWAKDSEYVFPAKFGDHSTWARETDELIFKDTGFNSVGPWSDEKVFKEIGQPKPYHILLGVMGAFSRKLGTYKTTYGCTENIGNVMPVFHPDLPDFIDSKFAELAHLAEDPWLFGVFSDNEISMYERQILSRFLTTDTSSTECAKAKRWLAEKGIAEDEITPEHDYEFCKHILDTYFGMIRAAKDKYLPNHMYLGTRFHKAVTSQLSAYEAIGPYADIVSVNLYHRWTPDQRDLNTWSAAAEKPLMFTEWYMKGIDSGMRNISGAGMTVNTQRERGMFYENFTLSLIRNPNVIGWHWFHYIDDGPLHCGLHSVNKGIVNIHFEPYPELIGAMKRINRVAYSLRDQLVGFSHPNLPDRAPIMEDPDFDEVETDRVYTTPIKYIQNG